MESYCIETLNGQKLCAINKKTGKVLRLPHIEDGIRVAKLAAKRSGKAIRVTKGVNYYVTIGKPSSFKDLDDMGDPIAAVPPVLPEEFFEDD